MELCTITSGSSGNCIYVGSGNTHLIVDAGISGKRIEAGLNSIGLKTSEMNGLLITHEHSDHVASVGVLARKYGLPIYATGGTIEALKNMKQLGNVPFELFHEIDADDDFHIGDINVRAVNISHDAAQPVAYRFTKDNKSVGVLTDLGTYTDYTVNSFKGVDALVVEANHDVNMLQVGPYPYPLKQRILGERGHLSNELCGQLLCELIHDNIKKILLGHLSKENNMAELAYETVRLEILMDECEYKPEDFDISVASRDACSQFIAV